MKFYSVVWRVCCERTYTVSCINFFKKIISVENVLFIKSDEERQQVIESAWTACQNAFFFNFFQLTCYRRPKLMLRYVQLNLWSSCASICFVQCKRNFFTGEVTNMVNNYLYFQKKNHAENFSLLRLGRAFE